MFRKKYHVLFVVVALLAVGLLVVFQLFDDGGRVPGQVEPGTRQEAIPGPPAPVDAP